MEPANLKNERVCIELNDMDFAAVIEDPEIRAKLRRTPVILGSDSESMKQKIIDAMPRAVAKKVMAIIPEDLQLYEISLKVSFSAKPLDIGVETDATIKFGPRRSA